MFAHSFFGTDFNTSSLFEMSAWCSLSLPVLQSSLASFMRCYTYESIINIKIILDECDSASIELILTFSSYLFKSEFGTTGQ